MVSENEMFRVPSLRLKTMNSTACGELASPSRRSTERAVPSGTSSSGRPDMSSIVPPSAVR